MEINKEDPTDRQTINQQYFIRLGTFIYEDF